MNLEKENEMTAQTFTIELPNFREARPVAEIVQTASQYESEIYFVSGNKKINAKSIMGMMSLGLCNDEEIEIQITEDNIKEIFPTVPWVDYNRWNNEL